MSNEERETYRKLYEMLGKLKEFLFTMIDEIEELELIEEK